MAYDSYNFSYDHKAHVNPNFENFLYLIWFNMNVLIYLLSPWKDYHNLKNYNTWILRWMLLLFYAM